MADLNLEAFEELLKVSLSLRILISKRSSRLKLVRKGTASKARMISMTDEGQDPETGIRKMSIDRADENISLDPTTGATSPAVLTSRKSSAASKKTCWKTWRRLRSRLKSRKGTIAQCSCPESVFRRKKGKFTTSSPKPTSARSETCVWFATKGVLNLKGKSQFYAKHVGFSYIDAFAESASNFSNYP